MASLEQLADILAAQIDLPRDSTAFNAFEFNAAPGTSHTPGEAVLQQLMALPEDAENPAFASHALLFGRFLPSQAAIIRSLVPWEDELLAACARFDEVNQTPKREWQRAFAPAARLERLRRRGNVKRAWLAFLNLPRCEYEFERSWLCLSVDELRKRLLEEEGVKVARQTPAEAKVAAALADGGPQHMLRWVRGDLRDALSFRVIDAVNACSSGIISGREAKHVQQQVHAHGDRRPPSVARFIGDAIQPDANAVLKRWGWSMVHTPLLVDASGRPLLCRHCGATFLEGENATGGWCCKHGAMNRFRLHPLPDVLRSAFEDNVADGTDWLNLNSRQLNNHFCFARLRTKGWARHGAVDVNGNSPNAALKVCGRVYLGMAVNDPKCFTAYLRDGTEPPSTVATPAWPDFVARVREALVDCHPLARGFRQCCATDAPDHRVVICLPNGHLDEDGGPPELAVLVVPPEHERLAPREFEIEVNRSDGRPGRFVRMQILDPRCDPCHYPILHTRGELGWGPETCEIGGAGGGERRNCTLEDYIRFRLLSADFVPLPPPAQARSARQTQDVPGDPCGGGAPAQAGEPEQPRAHEGQRPQAEHIAGGQQAEEPWGPAHRGDARPEPVLQRDSSSSDGDSDGGSRRGEPPRRATDNSLPLAGGGYEPRAWLDDSSSDEFEGDASLAGSGSESDPSDDNQPIEARIPEAGLAAPPEPVFRERRAHVPCGNMDEAGGIDLSQHAPDSEDQVPYVHMAADGRAKVSTNRLHMMAKVGQEATVDWYSRVLDQRTIFEKNKSVNTQRKEAGDEPEFTSHFFGSRRHMRDLARNGMLLVKRIGLPLLFITMTCSSAWQEFESVNFGGQRPLDSPAWTARVFRKKTQVLKKMIKDGSMFPNMQEKDKLCFSIRGGAGEMGYMLDVIEFQKRGMPHIHILYRPHNGSLWEARMKAGDFEWLDSIVSAEVPADTDIEYLRRFGFVDESGEMTPCALRLPNGAKYAELGGANALLQDLQAAIKQHMIHKCTKRYCRENGDCRFKYPFDIRDSTGLTEDGRFLLYRRRKECDRHVVPHSPWLLLLFECHLNVVVCHDIGCIGYVYKYIFKGVDHAKFGLGTLDASSGTVLAYDAISEMERGRYLSCSESVWRSLGFNMYSQTPSVKSIEVHDTGMSTKIRGWTGLEKYLARPMLTDREREVFEQLTFCEFHEQFVCRKTPFKDWRKDCQWHAPSVGQYMARRLRNRPKFHRIKDVPLSSTEAWALRCLLSSLPCPRKLDGDGIPIPSCRNYLEGAETYMGACVRLGLYKHGREAEIVFKEQCEQLRTPRELRWTLSYLMLGGHHVMGILQDEDGSPNAGHMAALTADAPHLGEPVERYQHVLRGLWKAAEEAGLDAESEFGLPPPDLGFRAYDDEAVNKEISRWSVPTARAKFERNLTMVRNDSTQLEAYEEICDHIDTGKGVKWFFIDGAAGTGKSTFAQALIWKYRAQRKVVKVCALTWLAASNFERGVSLHHMFRIRPGDIGEAYVAKLAGGEQRVMDEAVLIVIDEISFSPEDLFACVHDYIERRHKKMGSPHAVAVVTCGDFKQLPPVTKGISSEQGVLMRSVLASPKWRSVRRIRFTRQHRVEDAPWAEFVAAVGVAGLRLSGPGDDGHERNLETVFDMSGCKQEHLEGLHNSDCVRFELPDGSRRQFTSDAQDVVRASRDGAVVLTATNAQRREWNTFLQSELREADTAAHATTPLPAVHEVTAGDSQLISDAEMREHEEDGVPAAALELRRGDLCVVVGSIGGITELVNNTRVRVVQVHRSRKAVTVAPVGDANKRYDIPRRWYKGLFKNGSTFSRLQFPLELAYAVTIHKGQGQTMRRAVLDLSRPVFMHGQLYVAISRVRRREHIIFYTSNNLLHGATVSANNIVFRSFLSVDNPLLAIIPVRRKRSRNVRDENGVRMRKRAVRPAQEAAVRPEQEAANN